MEQCAAVRSSTEQYATVRSSTEQYAAVRSSTEQYAILTADRWAGGFMLFSSCFVLEAETKSLRGSKTSKNLRKNASREGPGGGSWGEKKKEGKIDSQNERAPAPQIEAPGGARLAKSSPARLWPLLFKSGAARGLALRGPFSGSKWMGKSTSKVGL